MVTGLSWQSNMAVSLDHGPAPAVLGNNLNQHIENNVWLLELLLLRRHLKTYLALPHSTHVNDWEQHKNKNAFSLFWCWGRGGVFSLYLNQQLRPFGHILVGDLQLVYIEEKVSLNKMVIAVCNR